MVLLRTKKMPVVVVVYVLKIIQKKKLLCKYPDTSIKFLELIECKVYRTDYITAKKETQTQILKERERGKGKQNTLTNIS